MLSVCNEVDKRSTSLLKGPNLVLQDKQNIGCQKLESVHVLFTHPSLIIFFRNTKRVERLILQWKCSHLMDDIHRNQN